MDQLKSYLVSITADIFKQKDNLSENRLIDMILDSAHQKGTGAWTTEDAMALQVPVPVIDVAVSMRNISILKEERLVAQKQLQGPDNKSNIDKKELVDSLEHALYFSIITVFAQGMALLKSASDAYHYDLKLEDIAGIWREGCIIRASVLDDIMAAVTEKPLLPNLMLSGVFKEKLEGLQENARRIVKTGIDTGIPLPAFRLHYLIMTAIGVAGFLIIFCRRNVIISEPIPMSGQTERANFIPNGIKNSIRNGYNRKSKSNYYCHFWSWRRSYAS